MRIVALWVGLLWAAQLWADAQPVKMSAEGLRGGLLASALKQHSDSELGPLVTEDVETFLSSDRRLDAGIYRSGAARFTIDQPYGVDEFMYFLEGRLTLTSSDGQVTVVNAGEAVTIPKAWTGVWDSTAYTKIYVIYSPDALLPGPGAETSAREP